jgi:hypothetical protein
MIEDTEQELVKAINSVTSEQKDKSVITELLNKVPTSAIATLNDKGSRVGKS